MATGEDSARLFRQRLIIIGVFSLFFIPFFGAWFYVDYLRDEGVIATTNAGSLIHPARPLPEVLQEGPMFGKWTYAVFQAGGQCNAECEKKLYYTRQIRTSVNKDMKRVQRYFITDAPLSAELKTKLAREHDDLKIIQLNAQAWNAWMEPLTVNGSLALDQRYFLVDPLGNLMMYYDIEVDPRAVLMDLQKLLKASRIG